VTEARRNRALFETTGLDLRYASLVGSHHDDATTECVYARAEARISMAFQYDLTGIDRMRDVSASAGSKLKVFISYSRRDLDFADQVTAVLEWHGFAVTIDRKGIHGAEKWEERLGQLILGADVVVFVLSPDSAGSEVCAWEVEEATRRGKRIVPIVCRPLEDQRPHERLRDLNYIFFCPDKEKPGAGFGTGQLQLIEALSVDIGWLREHTRAEELAQRWENSGRPGDQLLRGSELAATKAWRDRRPANAPELTELQRLFLAASEEEEVSRTGAERKLLEEMAAANTARAKALSDAEAALKREAEAQQAREEAQKDAVEQAKRVVRRTQVFLAILVATTSLAAVKWIEAEGQRKQVASLLLDATFYVLESTVPALKVGSTLPMRTVLRVPEAGFVRVVLPSGKTQTITGSFTGTIEAYAMNRSVPESLWDTIKALVQREPPAPGATR
jgi:hypothetical protein